MVSPRFDNTYNWGHVLQLGGIGLQSVIVLAAIIGFWLGLSSRLSNVENKMGAVADLASAISEATIINQQQEIYIKQLQENASDQKASAALILQQISAIREDLAAIKAKDNFPTR